MGYTHYWTHTKALSSDEWTRLETALKAIIHTARQDGLALSMDDGTTPISAHEALTGAVRTNAAGLHLFRINGLDPDACETFSLYQDTPMHDGGFDFCKTRQLPYDTVVTAILSVAESWFPDHIEVSSDGAPEDWTEGLDLARRALPAQADSIRLPTSLRPDDP